MRTVHQSRLPLLAVTLAALVGCTDASSPPPPPGPVTPVDLATAGTIHAVVDFAGSVPPARELDLRGTPHCAAAHQEPVYDAPIVARDGHLSNAVVFIKSGFGDRAFTAPTEPLVIDQAGCIYVPRVAAVMVGQPLEFHNSDPEPHNVRGRPEIVRAWNFMMSRQNSSRTIYINKPEVGIAIGCDVHPWMRAYVSAFSNPYFAVTPADGSVTLEPVPPGQYVVGVWHEDLGTQEQTVTLAPKGGVTVNFTYDSPTR